MSIANFAANNSSGYVNVCPSAGHSGDKSTRLVAAEWCIRVFGAIIIVGGAAGNLATAYIQGTERSNRGTTRFLMVSLALTDCAVLLLAVVRYWLTETLQVDIRDLHPVVCFWHQAVVATVSDVAVYTLCGIGVERFIAVAFPYRVQQLLTGRNLGIAYGSLVAIMVAKNAPIVFYRHVVECVRLLSSPAKNLTRVNNQVSWEQLVNDLDDTDYTVLPHRCSYDKAFGQWFAKLDLVTYLFIPYTILLFCNIYIYAAIRRQAAAVKKHKSKKTSNNRNKQDGGGGGRRKPESVMKILAVLTVIHIITTLPASITQVLNVYGYKFPDDAAMRRVTLNALKTLMFANNATNFVAYFISSTVFRSRVLRYCRGGSHGGGAGGRKSVTGAAVMKNGGEKLELAAPSGRQASVTTKPEAGAAPVEAVQPCSEVTQALIVSGDRRSQNDEC
ncbi:hypothetical protein BOX15_Mlig017324g3 [Macrostomum lignano]|uniref:G-protein coupled receptors family 1 profile domain-containing protein n=1 Tax=Macrostomum lignano TaxID=282301 RepID=A0A267FSS9_9PLAT|nr:hypothetical protein BOX15_Mlig017324g3 [Macrostomum lignano]